MEKTKIIAIVLLFNILVIGCTKYESQIDLNISEDEIFDDSVITRCVVHDDCNYDIDYVGEYIKEEMPHDNIYLNGE